jgi:peptidoglycan DL-endopeptidase CwlO
MPAFSRRLSPVGVTIAVCLVGAVICAAFVLTSGVRAFAALPPDLQSAQLTGSAATQVGDLTAQANTVQTEIDKLDGDLEGYTETFNLLQFRLTEINTQLSDLRRQLTAAQKEHQYRVQKFDNRLVALYKSGGDEGLLTVLFDSNGLSDLINRMRLLATLADQDQHLVANLGDSTQELDQLVQQIEDTKSQELAIRDQIEGQKNSIETALATREQTLTTIDSSISAIITQQRQQQASYIGPVQKTGNAVVDQLIETALYYQGVPYVWAGDRVGTGFDCSGFVQYVFRQHGVDLPHYSGYMAQMGSEIQPENIQAGDVLTFGWPVHHVGIYLGNGLFIHAPRTGDVVRIAELSSRHDLAYIRRFNIQPRVGAPSVW